ncbi:MAG: hypothetical protein AB1646_16875 [Thermodesulfobacteriota bacterium]
MKGLFIETGRAWIIPLLAVLALTPVCVGPAHAQDTTMQCESIVSKWEQVYQEMKTRLGDLKALEQTPVSRFTDGPLVHAGSDKPIAAQISAAMDAKEAALDARRKECRYVMELEETLFEQAQGCLARPDVSAKRGKQNKGPARIVKERQLLISTGAVALANVREVEGKEQYYPEEAAYPAPDMNASNNRSAWQNYMNMYRGFWR